MNFKEGLGKLKKGQKRWANWGIGLMLLKAGVLSASASGGVLLPGDTTVCYGKTITLSSKIAGTCQWSTGATGSSIQITATQNKTIGLSVTVGTITYTDSITVYVDKNCVYSGDANEDGLVNGSDFLKIGVAYGSTGAKRANASMNWDGQHADNWTKKFKSGLNYKYADCNGDGVVDYKDLDALHDNWSDTHNKTDEATADGIPGLYYVANKDTVHPGDTLTLHIYLGTITSPINDIYGLSWTHQFDPNSVQTGSMQFVVSTDNCWLYGTGSNYCSVMAFMQPDYVNNKVDLGICRTNGSTVSGYGQIGDLSIVISDNLGSKRSLSDYLTMHPIGITAIGADESEIKLSLQPAKVFMDANGTATGIEKHNVDTRMSIYPNPVIGNGTLTIQLTGTKVQKMEITDLVGRTVYSSTIPPATGKFNISLPQLTSGVYMVRAYSGQGILTRKLNIVNN